MPRLFLIRFFAVMISIGLYCGCGGGNDKQVDTDAGGTGANTDSGTSDNGGSGAENDSGPSGTGGTEVTGGIGGTEVTGGAGGTEDTAGTGETAGTGGEPTCDDEDDDSVCDEDDQCEGEDDRDDDDNDGVPDGCDICDGGDDQLDSDDDGIPNFCDVCVGDDSDDADSDGVPDDCDVCTDGDDDEDADDDGIPDACDPCPSDDEANDADDDGVADDCDECEGYDDTVDTDDDGVADGCDVCEGHDDDGADADSDDIPDACDACPGSDDDLDADSDGIPDGCDVCASGDDTVDTDGDEEADACDLCPLIADQDDAADADTDGVPDACDPCGVGRWLAADPVLFYRLGEANQSDPATNAAGDYLHGVYGAGVEVGYNAPTDDENTAAYLSGDATDTSVTVAGVDVFDGDAITVEFWVFLESVSGAQTPLSYAVSGNANELLVYFTDKGISLYIDGLSITSGDVLLPYQWQHVAATWRDTGDTVIYHNGVPVLSTVAAFAMGRAIENGGTIMLGQEQDSVGGSLDVSQALHGRLDEFAIYNDVLSQEEIVAHMGSHCSDFKPRNCADVLGTNSEAADGVYSVYPTQLEADTSIEVYCDMTTDGGGWTRCATLSDADAAGDDACVKESDEFIDNGSLLNQSWCEKYFRSFEANELLVHNITSDGVSDDYGFNDKVQIDWSENGLLLYTYDNRSVSCYHIDATGGTVTEFDDCQYATHNSEPWASAAWSFTMGELNTGYTGAFPQRVLLGPTFNGNYAGVNCRWHNFGADTNPRNSDNSWVLADNAGYMYLR